MKIALASAPVKNRDVPFNLQAMEAVIDSCKGKADVIVFGESVLQGFDCLCWEYEKDKAMMVQITDAPIARMRAAAQKAHMAVSFGFIEGGRRVSVQQSDFYRFKRGDCKPFSSGQQRLEGV